MEKLYPGTGEPQSPLWFPETDTFLNPKNDPPSRWFIEVPTIFHDIRMIGMKEFYWDWCDKCCIGKVRCYASGDASEWWGFTNKKDIVLWALMWGTQK